MPNPVNDQILAEARRLCDQQFRPRAEDADRGTIDGIVKENVLALAKAGYFGLGIPAAYGGFGADEPTRREYAELCASACGVTAFVQQQLHAGGGFVGGGRSDALKAEWLPRFAAGESLCGVAFSHLRRSGPPMLKAVPVKGGYVLNGIAPWVTGWALLDSFILGATLPDGNHLFVLAVKGEAPQDPVTPDKDPLTPNNGGTGRVSSPRTSGVTLGLAPPFLGAGGGDAAPLLGAGGPTSSMTPGSTLPLVVMNASDTREVTFTDFFVPDDLVLYERPAESLQRSDFCGISGHVFLPLGCARGSVLYLREMGNKHGSDSVLRAADALSCEIDGVREQALLWNGSCADRPEYKENALKARASAIVLAVRAAHAAVTAAGGSAHLLSSPPQRLLREAIFYTTTAQTFDVRSTTLEILISPECWRKG